ncbi:hypothetical protein JXO52_05235 [bacterium]|nr:hypothetical protein [bacterium]
MNPLISLIRIFLAVSILQLCYRDAPAQQNEKRIARETISRLASDSEFAFSEAYDVINPKSMHIEIDADKSSATICFSSHPVYTFAVEYIDYESDAVSISGRYLELTGNGTAGFYIDRAEKKVYVKRRTPDGTVRKLLYGAITVTKTSSGKERLLFKRNSNVTFKLHKTRNQVCADFYYSDFLVFTLHAVQLEVNGVVNPDVWDLTGNTDDTLSFNISRKILYFRQGDPKIIWAGVEKSAAR